MSDKLGVLHVIKNVVSLKNYFTRDTIDDAFHILQTCLYVASCLLPLSFCLQLKKIYRLKRFAKIKNCCELFTMALRPKYLLY